MWKRKGNYRYNLLYLLQCIAGYFQQVNDDGWYKKKGTKHIMLSSSVIHRLWVLLFSPLLSSHHQKQFRKNSTNVRWIFRIANRGIYYYKRSAFFGHKKIATQFSIFFFFWHMFKKMICGRSTLKRRLGAPKSIYCYYTTL